MGTKEQQGKFFEIRSLHSPQFKGNLPEENNEKRKSRKKTPNGWITKIPFCFTVLSVVTALALDLRRLRTLH